MAEELGQNFKLYVGSTASPYTYAVLAGQRALTRNVATNFIDISSKSSGVYGQQAVGRGNLTIEVSGQRVLPDANGLERAHTLATTRVAGMFRICKTDVSPVKVVFECSMFVGNFSLTDNDQEGSTFSFTLSVASTAPTVDDMTPA